MTFRDPLKVLAALRLNPFIFEIISCSLLLRAKQVTRASKRIPTLCKPVLTYTLSKLVTNPMG